MIELAYYDKNEQEWVNAEENGKTKEFEDEREAEEWLEKKDEKDNFSESFDCFCE